MYKSWKLRNKEVYRKINVSNFILKVSWNKHMYWIMYKSWKMRNEEVYMKIIGLNLILMGL